MVRTSITSTTLIATVTSAAVSLVALSSVASAQITATIVSSTQWCMFLPPQPGEDIGSHEDSAVAFCTKGALGLVPNARVFPDNFIVSQNFVKNDNYVQMTGQLNPYVYVLPTDEGGQFDNEGAPVGATCVGYSSFVNLVEPSANRYCIRCCNSRTTDPNDKNSCLFNHSKDGCAVVMGGDYGPTTTFPSMNSSSSTSSPSSLPSSHFSSSSSSSSSALSSSSSLSASSSSSSSSSLYSPSPRSTSIPPSNAAGRMAAPAFGALLVISLAALLM